MRDPVIVMADASELLTSVRTVEEVLEHATRLAREVAQCHQALGAIALDEEWQSCLTATDLSAKYASYRSAEAGVNRRGIAAPYRKLVEPVRLTQDEVRQDPLFKDAGTDGRAQPPMRGLLVVPVLNPHDGSPLGVIQVTDRVAGELAVEDEHRLVALARLAALAITRTADRPRPTRSVLEHAFAATPNAVLVFDRDDRTALASDAVRRILGRDPRDLRDLLDLLSSYGAQQTQISLVRDALLGRDPLRTRLSLPVRSVDVLIDVRLSPVGDTGHEEAMRVVNLADVTAVERQSRVRRELVDVVDKAAFGMVLLTPVETAGRITDFEVSYANREASRIHGPALAPGHRLADLPGPIGRPSFARYLVVWDTHEPDSTLVRFEAEGTEEWFDVRVVRMGSSLLVGLVNATARKAAAERLRQSEELLRTSQRVARLGTFEWYVGRDELRWTDEMYTIVRVDPETFAHSYEAFLELLHPDDRKVVDELMGDCIAHGVPYSGDMRRLMPDGTVYVLHAEGRMVYERGEPPRFVGTVQDVTEARELEEAIRRTQRVESLGQMAAGVAHDFNNILTVVTMHAHLLRDTLEQTPDAETMLEDLAGIEDATERATNLTRQLLAFTGQQVRQPVVLDLGDVVDHVTPMLARLVGEEITLDVRTRRGVPVRADRTQLEQVLINLVVNARDAIEGAGRIGVGIDVVGHGHSAVAKGGEAAPIASRWALLEVHDDGHGMSEQVRDRALDPFFTTKPQGKGTGLGLSVVFGIVQQSGGRVSIWTEPGRGTTMSVVLPLEGVDVRTDGVHPAEGAAKGDETVLVVEDDATVRELVARTLRDYGYDVLTAQDGEEALLVLASTPGVAAVVSDVAMPRMGGLALDEAIRARHPEVGVLLMSGYTPPDSLPREDGTAFIAKPLTGDSLAGALREVLDR